MNDYVRMVDGSRRTISDLCLGDRIMDTNFKMLTVMNIFVGTEEKKCTIRTKGHDCISLAMNQTIMTKDGLKFAKDITLDDSLLLFEGGYAEVEKIEHSWESWRVYELCTDEAVLFGMNDYVVGSYEKCRELERRQG